MGSVSGRGQVGGVAWGGRGEVGEVCLRGRGFLLIFNKKECLGRPRDEQGRFGTVVVLGIVHLELQTFLSDWKHKRKGRCQPGL